MSVWKEIAKYGMCSPANPQCRIRTVLDGEQWCDVHQQYVMRRWEAMQFIAKKKKALSRAPVGDK